MGCCSGGSVEDGFLALRLLAAQKQLGEGASVHQTGLCRVECNCAPIPEDKLPPGAPSGFVYRVSIEHTGTPGSEDPDQLRCFRLSGRHWMLAEEGEEEEEIVPKNSPGVVGHTPTFGPGDRFVYSSGVTIQGHEATMRGSLQMEWLPPSASAAAAAADKRLPGARGGDGETAKTAADGFDAIIAPFRMVWPS